MRFSLILSTLGRRDELADFFASVVKQGRSDIELIVVDQNGDDRLVEVIARFSERLPIKHIRMTESGLSRGRNLGLPHATGELIGFPDDDCQYLGGYLDIVDSIFARERSVDIITGCPTADAGLALTNWDAKPVETDATTVLHRCQEFTIFFRRERLGATRFNEMLGIGAPTPWNSDEGPDFLIRLINKGCRLVFYPQLFVYHPNKIAVFNQQTWRRAQAYSQGRGCLFRLHGFPLGVALKNLARPAAGCALYLARLQFARSAYYYFVVAGMLRGLMISAEDLAKVRHAGGMPSMISKRTPQMQSASS